MSEEQEIIPVQVAWAIIGEKEWQLQMERRRVAQLQQKLNAALAELAALKAELAAKDSE